MMTKIAWALGLFILLLAGCAEENKENKDVRYTEKEKVSLFSKYKDALYIEPSFHDRLKKIFPSFKQLRVIEEGIGLFEEQKSGRYAYAAFLDSQYDESTREFEHRGATVGRIFTTFTSKEDFIYTDAYRVIEELRKLDDSLAIVKLVFEALPGYKTFMPTRAFLIDKNYEKSEGDFIVTKKSQADDSFLSRFMYEWQTLAKTANKDFRYAQDMVYFQDTHAKVIDFLDAVKKEGYIEDFSDISAMTYMVILDGFVLNGVNYGEYLLPSVKAYGEIRTKEAQEGWIRTLLEKTAEIEEVREHRSEALLYMLNHHDGSVPIMIDEIKYAFMQTE